MLSPELAGIIMHPRKLKFKEQQVTIYELWAEKNKHDCTVNYVLYRVKTGSKDQLGVCFGNLIEKS